MDVRMVYKNFPLRSHRYALAAATAALAAEKQGQFWEMHDLLYLNSRELGFQKIIDIARELSLDEKQLLKDMNDPGVLKLIDRDVREGRRIGVQSTPTVFVNGIPLRDRNFDGFQATIENILDGLGRKPSVSANSAIGHRP